MKSVVTALVALSGAMVSLDASALFSERYLVCREEEAKAAATTAEASVPSVRTPIPKRRAPEPLEIGELVIADLVTPNVVSFGKAEEDLPSIGPIVARESTNDFRCLGLVRGRAGILRVVSAPPRARFRGHPYPENWIDENIQAAAVFHLEETIPFLERILRRPVPQTIEDHTALERVRLKVSAATALADFGHKASAPEIASFLREREASTFPGFWEDAVEALGRVDPALGHAYAVERLGEIGEVELETREQNQLRALLPLLVRRDPEAVARLVRVQRKFDPTENGGSHLSCLLFAARIRAGDDALRKGFQTELAQSLVTNRSATCYSETMEVAFPGDDPSEVDTLLFRHRYEALIRLVAAMRDASTPSEARFEAARAKIRAWLRVQASDPRIGTDARDTRFQPEERARHHALAAALGDTALAKRLETIALDPDDGGAWVAVIAALDLRLPGAADLAAKRLLLAHRHASGSVRREPWRKQGKLTITEHGEVVLRLFGRGDDRFVFGLLDREVFTRELTASLLARRKPDEALCRGVIDNATLAEDKPIQDALWALSIHGDVCRPALQRAFADAKSSPEVAGMALEGLAMSRTPKLEGEIERRKRKKDPIGVARDRARIIVRSPE